jgi:ribosomal protein S18 acetylase RimI-like enzyme
VKSDVQPLPIEQWKGHKLPFSYSSTHFYDAVITQSDGIFSAVFTKTPFETQYNHVDEGFDSLYQDHWDGAEAYGIFDGGNLAACIEIWREEWSNRLRVTEMWVAESYRRQGLGAKLMSFAKQKAAKLKCRAVMLETQSCNANAIEFYLSQGFTFFGFDRSCYGNRDVERREVRLELGIYLEV